MFLYFVAFMVIESCYILSVYQNFELKCRLHIQGQRFNPEGRSIVPSKRYYAQIRPHDSKNQTGRIWTHIALNISNVTI